jgi:hypothetical protein
MGIFRSERTVNKLVWINNGWGSSRGEHKDVQERYTNVRGKLALTAIIAAGVYGFFSDKGLGVMGHTTTERSDESMLSEAQAKYKLALEKASPSQLFALRYTDSTFVPVHRTSRHHSGIRGFMDNANSVELNPIRTYEVKDGCLNDTAYDINGGQLSFNVTYHGLSSTLTASASGDVPTAAAQASYNPESSVLTITSGNAHSENLHFNLESDQLSPADSPTKNILMTYGCHESTEYSSFVGDRSI